MTISNDTYILPDGRSIRVINANLLIKLDSSDQVSRGGIHIPKGAYENPYGTGQVVAVGYVDATIRDEDGNITEVRKIPIPGVEVGDGVYIVRFLDGQDSNVALQRVYGEGLIRIKPKDIIFVFDYATDRHRFQAGNVASNHDKINGNRRDV